MRLNRKLIFCTILLLLAIISFNTVSAANINQTNDFNDNTSVIIQENHYNNLNNEKNQDNILTNPSNNVIYVNNSYTGDTEDGSENNPYRSISDAVNKSSNGGTIYIANGNYNINSKISIPENRNLSIIGQSKDNVLITSSAINPIFELIEENSTLYFFNLTFSNISSGNYAVLKIGGNSPVTIEDCIFKDYESKYGAIHLYTNSEATVNNCSFINGKCSKTGGVGSIYLSGKGKYNVYNSNFENISYLPSSGYMYGLIYNYQGQGNCSIINSSFLNTKGAAYSIFYNKGEMHILNSIINNNTVEKSSTGYQGDCIFFNKGDLYIQKSTITNNSAEKYIFNQEGSFNFIINNNTIYDNTYGTSEINGQEFGTLIYENNTNISNSSSEIPPGNYIITNSTFFNFFDSYGNLLSNITEGSNLTFYGDFNNLPGISSITLTNNLNIYGENASLKNIIVQLLGDNILFNNFTMLISADSKLDNAIITSGNNIKILNNTINLTASGDSVDSNTILSDSCNNLTIENNKIYFYGNETDNKQFKDISIDIEKSNNIKLNNNTLYAYLPSCAVEYDSYYNAKIKSGNVFIDNSSNLTINYNNITTLFNDEANDSYDTIYGVYISKTPNVTVNSNRIISKGNNYIYGLSLIGAMDYTTYKYITITFNVSNNYIESITDKYGSWGTQTQVSDGSFTNNTIITKANNISYGMYSEGSMGPTYVQTYNNTINSTANSVWGISASGRTESIKENNVTTNGNYTIGIFLGLFGSNSLATVRNNNIKSNGKNLGNSTGGHNETSGIYVYRGKSYIQLNNISTSGEYSINLGQNNNQTVTDNYLISNSSKGDSSVYTNKSNNLIKDNYPAYEGIVYVSVDGNDTNEGSKDAPLATIKKALEIALNKYGSHHIIINSGVYNESSLSIDDDLIMEGFGINRTIIDGQNKSVIIQSYGNLSLINLSLINGNNNYQSGGAIQNNLGNLSLNYVKINNSQTFYNGGAIYNSGNLIINNTEITNNIAGGSGGGIYNGINSEVEGTFNFIIENSNISNNTANSNEFGGGAIYMQLINGVKKINNTTFNNNKGYYGGAIFVQRSSGNFNINNTQFINNSINSSEDKYGGGAICLIGDSYTKIGNLIITKSILINNSAKCSAGGIFDRNIDLNISNSIILYNYDKNNQTIVKSTTSFGPSFKINLDNNWWGNTKDNVDFNSMLVNNTNNPNYWLILNLTSEKSDLILGNKSNIKLDLIKNQNGETIDITKLPENIPVNFEAINGYLNHYNGTLINGIENITYTANKEGNGIITADIYNIRTSININNTIDNTIYYNLDTNLVKYYRNSSNLIVNLKYSNGTAVSNYTISIQVCGKLYNKTTNDLGIAELAINLNPGKYNGIVYINDNLNQTIPINITVLVNNVSIEGSNLVKYYGNGSNLRIRLVDLNGVGISNVKVKYIIQGKTYYRTTDSMGYATLTINLYSGKYSSTILVDNPGYNSNKLSVNVTVLKIPGTLKIVNTNIRKGTYLKVRLLDKNNKPIKATQVKVTVCGKTYIKTTDANGYAYLKINLNPKKYDVKVSIKDTRNYDVKSASAKITVHK